MKKSLTILSSFAAFLFVTAQATMGAACIILVNQPKVPNCLLSDDK